MNYEYILSLVTVVVTIILGFISKKNEKISDKLIPIQNLVIGFIMAIIYFATTKDISLALTGSGLVAGGIYDIVHNLKKLFDIKNSESNEESER